ncbi:LysR family transcriptional regulator [Microbacterium album]|uniref:LysR family transcriptional regulator n=1 Tax=Microbacterium album TaxID=2053191 RepID=A0A917IBF6_9MICO|nr:LysR family transcriptional regulator [Microbacterium album]GGH33421.1 LysR family transcriptional regulator [Microbacterium album]
MNDLRRIDANLVVVLDAVLRERSLTRAGLAVGMSQPAVSGALAKLRALLDDQLLIRNGRSFDLTPKAERLQPLVRDALREVGRTFNLRPMFDPATSDRRFHIWASDYVLATMSSTLRGILRDEAPDTSVEFGTLTGQQPVSPVDLLRADVVISSVNRGIPGKRQSLFSDSLVCIASAENPRLRGARFELEDLADLPYAQVVFAENVITISDDALSAAGIEPRVAMTLPGFLSLPFMIQGTDMYGMVPSRVAELYAEPLGLVVADTPLPHSTLIEAVFWHPSKTNDPALRWLVSVLRKTAEVVEFGTEFAEVWPAPPSQPRPSGQTTRSGYPTDASRRGGATAIAAARSGEEL